MEFITTNLIVKEKKLFFLFALFAYILYTTNERIVGQRIIDSIVIFDYYILSMDID